ncbi:hypothetical protein SAMN05446037_1003250 [Anaerovirgula multivorans]|uniref:Uncharacterized protein n=1 Tax=Anaerovirgula multivorans TaxID=312168 RepID=A0A239BGN7_9FIRM|nr:hypothetical protein [Anaerovirgula multivorans]SNS06899.1 hypothetical protein SAMN05446037_1003250 [Anaerovirgula multivorans]
MDTNDQLSIEGLLQAWVNVSYKMFYHQEKSENNIENRRQIVARLRTKAVTEIAIYGMDDDSYTLEYKLHNNKIIKKIFIEK